MVCTPIFAGITALADLHDAHLGPFISRLADAPLVVFVAAFSKVHVLDSFLWSADNGAALARMPQTARLLILGCRCKRRGFVPFFTASFPALGFTKDSPYDSYEPSPDTSVGSGVTERF